MRRLGRISADLNRLHGVTTAVLNDWSRHFKWKPTCSLRVGATSLRSLFAFAAVLIASGCGTFVPEHQEGGSIDSEKNREAALALENAIVQSVHCEMRNAVIDVVGNNPNHASFAQGWSVQTTLTLTVDEKTTVAPSAFMSFLPSLFTLMFGGSAMTEATRVDTFNFYYAVDSLLRLPRCPDYFPTLIPHGAGSLLIRSDLKTNEWLFSVLSNRLIVPSEAIKDPKNGMQHKVTFIIDTSGNVTPGAKLATVTLMPSGTLLSVGRRRTHELLLTFGPANPAQKSDQVLSPNAQAMHQAALVASALQSANVRVTTP